MQVMLKINAGTNWSQIEVEHGDRSYFVSYITSSEVGKRPYENRCLKSQFMYPASSEPFTKSMPPIV